MKIFERVLTTCVYQRWRREIRVSGFIMSDKSLGLISIINNVLTPAVLSLGRPEKEEEDTNLRE